MEHLTFTCPNCESSDTFELIRIVRKAPKGSFGLYYSRCVACGYETTIKSKQHLVYRSPKDKRKPKLED